MEEVLFRRLLAGSVLLTALVAAGSLVGLASDGAFYAANHPVYALQALGVDLANLACVLPLLLLAAWLQVRRPAFRAVWLGVLLYLGYVIVYGVFTMRFNQLFLLYAAQLGGVLVLLALGLHAAAAAPPRLARGPSLKVLAGLSVLMGLAFLGMWLGELVPASLAAELPRSAAMVGLPTASFQALDAGVFFPLMVVFALLALVRKGGFAVFMVPVFLVFAAVMCACLVWLVLISAVRGQGFDLNAALMFGIPALVVGGLVAWHLTRRPGAGRQALLVIDMQVGPFRSASRHDEAGVVQRINRLAAAFRAAGRPVVWIQHDGRREDYLRPGSADWALLPELQAEAGDHYLAKTANDAFWDTGLQALLERLGVDTLCVTGCATDFCVNATVHGALTRGYGLRIVTDAHTTADRPSASAPAIIALHNHVWSNLTPLGGRVSLVECAALAAE